MLFVNKELRRSCVAWGIIHLARAAPHSHVWNMIAAKDISDSDSLEEWLTEWPKSQGMSEAEARQVAVQIAHRAAMRVLPIAWEWYQSKAAREYGGSSVAGLAAALYPDLAFSCDVLQYSQSRYGSRPMIEARRIGDCAKNYNWHNTTQIVQAAISSRAAAYASWSQDYPAAVQDALDAIASSLLVSHKTNELWSEISSDLTKLTQSGFSNHLGKLWNDHPNEFDFKAKEILSSLPVNSFWRSWYEAKLQGEHFPNGVVDELLKLTEEHWSLPDDQLNHLLDVVWVKHALAQDIERIKGSLLSNQGNWLSVIQRCHNGPPELVEDEIQVAKSVTIV